MKNDFRLEEIVRQVLDKLPSDLGQVRKDVAKNLQSALQITFSRLELVSRKEFDIQSELLSNTQALLKDLEKKIEAMEKDKNFKPADINTDQHAPNR